MLKEFSKFSKYIIYGTGSQAKTVYDTIHRFDSVDKIICVTDRCNEDGLPNKSEFMGKKVICRNNLHNLLDDDTVIIIGSSFADDIYMSLRELYPYFRNIYVYTKFSANLCPYPEDDGEIIPTEDPKWSYLSNILKDTNSKRLLAEIIGCRKIDACFVPYGYLRNYAGFGDYWSSVNPPARKKYNQAIVLDCGAYIGDSVIPICNSIPQNVKSYFAFEPGDESYEKLNMLPKSSPSYQRLIPVKKAISDMEQNIILTNTSFSNRKNVFSQIQ